MDLNGKATSVIRYNKQGNAVGTQNYDDGKLSTQEPQPIGKNRWGNIYQWAKGKVKEAFQFLQDKQSGYLKGVFNHPEIGEIDLIWGDNKGGLKHILQKHLIEADDFNSINDVIETIQRVISIGTITRQGTNISLDKDNNRVILAQSPEGTWIVTGYPKQRQQ